MIRIIVISGVVLNFRWLYQVKVMKMFEVISSLMVRIGIGRVIFVGFNCGVF